MIDFLVNNAFASDVEQISAGSIWTNMMPIVLIMVVFYFLLLRPQQKKMKEHQAMVKALQKGDAVVIAGGILGTVAKVSDDNIVLVEIAPEVQVKVRRDSVTEVLKNDSEKQLVSTTDDSAVKAKKTAKKSKSK